MTARLIALAADPANPLHPLPTAGQMLDRVLPMLLVFGAIAGFIGLGAWLLVTGLAERDRKRQLYALWQEKIDSGEL